MWTKTSRIWFGLRVWFGLVNSQTNKLIKRLLYSINLFCEFVCDFCGKKNKEEEEEEKKKTYRPVYRVAAQLKMFLGKIYDFNFVENRVSFI